MMLTRENPLLGQLEGVGPEIETFLGPEIATNEASTIWAQKKSIFFRCPPLPMARVMDFPH